VGPLREAVARQPANGQYRLALAACLASSGQEGDAKRELALAIHLWPDLIAAAEKQPRFEKLRGTPYWGKLRETASQPAASGRAARIRGSDVGVSDIAVCWIAGIAAVGRAAAVCAGGDGDDHSAVVVDSARGGRSGGRAGGGDSRSESVAHSGQPDGVRGGFDA